MSTDLQINSWLRIPGSDLQWEAARASGPGGQNVNQVATKVDLRFDLGGTAALSPSVKQRLAAQAGGRLDAQGRIIVVCQETRTQSRNLQLAREKLAELIRAALVVPKTRRATRPTRASKERRLRAKRARSDKKSGRGRVVAD